MPRLVRGREPTWITLTEATGEDPACRVLVKPYTQAGRAVGIYSLRLALEAGGTAVEGNIAFAVGVAGWAVLDWEGVGDEDGQPIPCTPDDVRELMMQHDVTFDAFDRLYVTPALAGDREKNGSSPLPRGTSPAGAAPKKTTKKTKRKASRGAAASTAAAALPSAKRALTAATSRKPKTVGKSGT